MPTHRKWAKKMYEVMSRAYDRRGGVGLERYLRAKGSAFFKGVIKRSKNARKHILANHATQGIKYQEYPRFYCALNSVSPPPQLQLIIMIIRSGASASCNMTFNISSGPKVYVSVLTARSIVPDTYSVLQMSWRSYAGTAQCKKSDERSS